MRPSGMTIKELAKVNGIDVRRPSASSPKCHIPGGLASRPAWGINLQLYELRSDRNWGLGDFADLWSFSEFAADLGADFVGLNPLHAGFMSDPDHCSPYVPSNRCFLNPLYIAVDEIGGFTPTVELNAKLAELRKAPLVDYDGVAKAKLEVLRAIWDSQAGKPNFAFEAFVAEGGVALHRHSLFETISHKMADAGMGVGWSNWPDGYRCANSPKVRAVEEGGGDDILFHKWLQWCAHVQLAEAKERALRAGMRIGPYLDLAVGEALDGSATWSEPEAYVSGAAIGNPPEPFAAEGQDWRLAALLPTTIAEGEESPFERMLEASMRYAGAIRIDHAAAFARLFLVPTDGVPANGAYVSYPTERMLCVLAAASERNGCLVIGEDLGNVADGLKEELSEADVLS